ncbi:Sec-independent protein translocase subunit TatA [Umezawaea beigongshangensis]|uniref:Sec-independent protein translocase subunit TatA n=1 Tax=Umezawaea beigongshangensis TaxID=2780383 RepID=UPI003F6879BE
MIILLFGAKKLPDMARSLGRSAKILKAETKGLRDDDEQQATTAQPPVQQPPAQLPPAQQAPVQQPPVQQVQPQVAPPIEQTPFNKNHTN